MPLSVVILAAGHGKRMNSDVPKVLQPLAGEPLLAHVIRAARHLCPDRILVVHGHGGAQVQAAFTDEPVEWVLQAEQLGTGHAVGQAMRSVPDGHTVLVLYGDVPLVPVDSLEQLVAAATTGAGADSGAALAILTVELDDATGYGRLLRDADGRVLGIVEEKDATSQQRRIHEANTGLLAAPATALRGWLAALRPNNAQRELYLTDVVGSAAKASYPIATCSAARAVEVLGVNDRIQLAQAETALRQIRARALMQEGATLADPLRIDIRGDIHVGRDVYFDVNTVLSGTVSLGARVRIGPNCVIRDATIGDDCEIFANSVIEGAHVAQGCRIGPFARLRPGARLGKRAHVGNFVELKNATLGEDSKANHLSYLGDAIVGNAVNVGAGTITCNYDGANKSQTIIGDGAFIGSGSMLVAPLRVGVDATIGAGSTLTQDAPDGKLTLARARQTTIENWARPMKKPAKPPES